MQGMELSKAYYETFGKKMIQEKFPDYADRIAVGLVGEGSECFGYDDEISQDHDYGAEFCMWLKRSDYDLIGEALQAEYEKLPAEFMGVRKQNQSLYGVRRRGVRTIEGFYESLVGSTDGNLIWQDYFFVPEYRLANAVNGEVFKDTDGTFTRIRERLKAGMPQDVRVKKIAAKAAYMAQSGQYNFSRCLRHGEAGAAQLALYEFVQNTVQMIYLLNTAYCPYYKWMFRGMQSLPKLSALQEPLTALLTEGNNGVQIEKKETVIEKICQEIVKELKQQNLTEGSWDYLESHALSVMEHIENPQIRSMHLLYC